MDNFMQPMLSHPDIVVFAAGAYIAYWLFKPAEVKEEELFKFKTLNTPQQPPQDFFIPHRKIFI